MDKLIVHQGDDNPSLMFRLKDIEHDCWLDLSLSTTVITAKFRKQGSTTVLQTITCSKLFGGATGYVQMDWPSDALDVDAGDYEIEVAVSFDGSIQTANKYIWEVNTNDWDNNKLPVKVKLDF